MPRRADQSFNGDEPHSMSFGDHLEELRRRLMLALAIPLPVMLGIFFVNQIFDNILIHWLVIPVTNALRSNNLPEQLQVLSPTEMIVLQMKLSMILALVLSAPWVLYQAWKFIEPGLYDHEKRFVHFLLPFSGVLSVAGIGLLYFVMLPLMLRVLIAFGIMGSGSGPVHDPLIASMMSQHPTVRIITDADMLKWQSAPQVTPKSQQTANQSPSNQITKSPNALPGEAYLTWPAMNLFVVVADIDGKPRIVEMPRSWIKQEFRLSEYINLVLMLMLAIALAFQMPLVITLLGWLGLASPAWLRRKRRYALMICGVIAVVITPPDALSALIMLIPLYSLYELGILLLLIAPASAVAKGRVFSLNRFRQKAAPEADNRREPMDHPRQSAQIEQPIPRRSSPTYPGAPDADGGEDGP